MESIEEIKKTLKDGLNLSKRADTAFRVYGANIYNLLFKFIVTLFILIAVGVWLNLHEYLQINLIISFLCLLFGILAFAHPEILVTIANIDIINRALPEKLQVDAVNALFDTFLRMAKRSIATCCLIFLFLGFVPIGGNLTIFSVALMLVFVAILIYSKSNLTKTKS